MVKKLFGHTAIYGLAPQISKLASFFVLPIITQDLTELDYGVAGIMTAYTTAISALSVLGLRLILVNSYYKSPGHFKWGWRQIYGFLTLWNIIYALLLSLLIFWAVPAEAFENRWLIMLLNVAPVVVFGPSATLGSTYFQVRQKPLQIGLRTGIFGILSVFLHVFFISYLKLGYMGWFWSYFIVGILSNISYWVPLNFSLGFKPIFNFKWRYIKNSLKVSLPTVPHYYSSYLLNSSDKLVMDLVNVNTGDIGRYNAAYIVGNVIQQIGDASGLAIGPLMMEKYKSGQDRSARNLIFLLQIAFFVLTFTICLWLKELFAFLIRNESLAQMYGLGVIIVMSYNYRPMYFGANNKLFFTEKTNVVWKVTFIAGLLNVVLNFLLIPIYGFEVAAYTTFVSLMFMGYAGFYLKVFKQINHVNYYPILWFLFTIILTIISIYAVDFSFSVKAFITASILGGVGLAAHKYKTLINEF